jgi:(p)ppGpp synthase/HD superfamily hydrolase
MPTDSSLADPQSAPLSPRFDDALVFAANLHREQRRKGSNTPYIAHLLAVTALALEHGAGEDEAIAALLHDAVEDQGGAPMLAEIRDRYGDTVADIVAGCTDTDQEHKPSWRPRKERYLAHIREAPASVRLVSAADKLHNARSVLADYRALGEDLWSRFTGGREGTLWFYRAMVDSLREGRQPGEERLDALIAELDRVVSELEQLAQSGLDQAPT